MRSERPASRGILLGLAAAASFGASTPFAKRLLADTSPQLLAGLLYLGAGVALVAILPSRRTSAEAKLRRGDLPRLGGLVLVGGVVAPVLMLVGLERVSGATGSLLLNLEGPFALLVGIFVFREHLGRWAWIGAIVIFGGAAILAGGDAGGADQLGGVLLISGAAALWGIDNNLTQSLTTRDPFQIVTVKVAAAAAVNLTIAVGLGAGRPPTGVLFSALALGAISYGLSVVLDAYALRILGAAREAAIFATAPFLGMIIAVPVLGERLGAREIAAATMMALGVVVLGRERHAHTHAHEPLHHEHLHVHDDHHQHDHLPGTGIAEPHSHPHRHGRLVHAGPHVSDAHHRHRHR